MYIYAPTLFDFHYLSSYNWKNEGVTAKSFNSYKKKNVSSIVAHRINRVIFCNKLVLGIPGGYNVHMRQNYKIFTICPRTIGKMKVLQEKVLTLTIIKMFLVL